MHVVRLQLHHRIVRQRLQLGRQGFVLGVLVIVACSPAPLDSLLGVAIERADAQLWRRRHGNEPSEALSAYEIAVVWIEEKARCRAVSGATATRLCAGGTQDNIGASWRWRRGGGGLHEPSSHRDECK